MKKISDLDKAHIFQWKRILLIKPNYTTKGWDFYNLNFPPLNLLYIASYLSDLELSVKILDTKAKNLDFKQIKKNKSIICFRNKFYFYLESREKLPSKN